MGMEHYESIGIIKVGGKVYHEKDKVFCRRSAGNLETGWSIVRIDNEADTVLIMTDKGDHKSVSIDQFKNDQEDARKIVKIGSKVSLDHEDLSIKNGWEIVSFEDDRVTLHQEINGVGQNVTISFNDFVLSRPNYE